MRDINHYEVRISMLSGRKGVSNTAIINKMKRRIRALERKQAEQK